MTAVIIDIVALAILHIDRVAVLFDCIHEEKFVVTCRDDLLISNHDLLLFVCKQSSVANAPTHTPADDQGVLIKQNERKIVFWCS